MHKGSKILFELCNEDDALLDGDEAKRTKSFCEKCYLDETKRVKEKEAKKP